MTYIHYEILQANPGKPQQGKMLIGAPPISIGEFPLHARFVNEADRNVIVTLSSAKQPIDRFLVPALGRSHVRSDDRRAGEEIWLSAELQVPPVSAVAVPMTRVVELLSRVLDSLADEELEELIAAGQEKLDERRRAFE